ncbi:MAG: MarR family transcriptional regulator for hemolysin [Candidatus Azotimanducaceae bacterium]|jgi:MarR family transcriptional regulator for hemolysin
MQDMKQEFVSALFNARNRIRFALDDHFKPFGVTDASWRTLFYLEQEGDGVQQKELARAMGIEGPSLVRLLDKLEMQNLIERKASTEDRRSKNIHLTDASREQLKALHVTAKEVHQSVLSDIKQDELEICIGVLKKIIAKSREIGGDEWKK